MLSVAAAAVGVDQNRLVRNPTSTAVAEPRGRAGTATAAGVGEGSFGSLWLACRMNGANLNSGSTIRCEMRRGLSMADSIMAEKQNVQLAQCKLFVALVRRRLH